MWGMIDSKVLLDLEKYLNIERPYSTLGCGVASDGLLPLNLPDAHDRQFLSALRHLSPGQSRDVITRVYFYWEQARYLEGASKYRTMITITCPGLAKPLVIGLSGPSKKSSDKMQSTSQLATNALLKSTP